MRVRRVHLLALGTLLAGCASAASERLGTVRGALDGDDNLLGLASPTDEFANPTGTHKTVTIATDGVIDTNNAFFQDLGTNGRACVSCHSPREAWGTSTAVLRRRFFATCKGDAKQFDPDHDNGQSDDHRNDFHTNHPKDPTCGDDPIFRLVDGANAPNADVSTDAARLASYSLLLNRGVIRIEMGVPANADFVVESVQDPNGYATKNRLSFYRRPLPATNLAFSGAFKPARNNPPPIMWDGRESLTGCTAGNPPPGAKCSTVAGDPLFGACNAFPGTTCSAGFCRAGANGESCGNPAATPTQTGRSFLLQQANNAHLGHAQAAAPLTPDQQASIVDFESALFTAQEKDNEAGLLSSDGANGGALFLTTQPVVVNRSAPIGTGFTENVFTIYSAWKDSENARRASIARGEELFNHKQGINPKIGGPISCTTCHNAFNAGNESAGTWGNGIMDSIGSWVSQSQVGSGDLPVYTVRRKVAKAGRPNSVVTTDLGRAAVTGKFDDIGKYKSPVLRGMQGRAPYFHNGSAATLGDVVDAYQAAGFQFNFTPEERADLIAFLESL